MRPPLRQTYTYVEMPVTQSTYDEIAAILREAKYDNAFDKDGTIDLHGLALVVKENSDVD